MLKLGYLLPQLLDQRRHKRGVDNKDITCPDVSMGGGFFALSHTMRVMLRGSYLCETAATGALE